ncbi:MAG: hypothetical protein CSB03_00135, partial [Bacteroidia bacterium]
NFFYKLDTLILFGEGKLNIVHIGDSHIQADYVSGQLRKHFQSMAWGLNGGRGFIFPVSLAKTNNPWNYKVEYTGEWEYCKNVQRNKTCTIGLAGFMASTTSKEASLNIRFVEEGYPQYYFTSVKIFHAMDTANWEIQPTDKTLEYQIFHNPELGYSQIYFFEEQSSLHLNITQKTDATEYTLYGLSLDNDDAGIVYHSAGVNGADVESWLRCQQLTQDLQVINPDFVIISLGTNDSYTSSFNASDFEQNMKELLRRVKTVAPDAVVLWVTPGDNYRRRRYLNYSTEKATKSILKVAAEENIIVWNFFDIMGHLNSILKWYNVGLTANDKLHYTQQGYEFQGDLMFNAFLKAYNQHIEKL